jgi:peptide/nickel transport system substrate-binding protein
VDSRGARLPYIDRLRLEIQQNRDIELVRFRRGELDLINSLDADVFEDLARQMPHSVVDVGPSMESEMMWFNQVSSSPLPAYKQAWFKSTSFRLAVSEAINRADICRIVYRGHAKPAEGPISPANQFWFNSSLKPHRFDPISSRRRFESEGFRFRGGQLYDRDQHPVEFSLVTNAGNRNRERIASMLQQDLQAVGIRLNVVTLDFPSLIERITKTFDYEACLLGLTNVDLDPSAQMNVWLSSAENHQWNPNQKQPATAWEAEIDKLMHAQAADTHLDARKRYFDRVQQIVSEQAPFLYLVTKNSLTAISPAVENASPAVLTPQAFWNVEVLRKAAPTTESR